MPKFGPLLDPRLKAELIKQKRPIGIGLACSAVASALTSAIIPLTDQIVGAVRLQDQHRITVISVFIVALFAVKYWFTRGQTYYTSKAAALLTTDLRSRLFRKLQRLPVTFFNERRAGAIQSVLTNDVAVYNNAITVVRDSIDGPIKVVIALVWIIRIQWQLAMAGLIVIPIMLVFSQRNSRKMRVAQAKVQEDLSEVTAMMQESLQGTRVVKAFSAEERIATQFDELLAVSLRSQIRAIRRIAQLKPTMEFIGALGLAAVVYFCRGLVANHSLTIEGLSAFLVGLDVINQGVKNIGSVGQTLAQVKAATDRIYGEILDIPETGADHRESKTIDRPAGRVEFRNVSFTYPDGTQALRNVSFSIDPGTSLALVGPSGAGKSTIADLMLRFYDPTEGEIYFDGVDIRDLKATWLRSQIGVVPQQTFLFAGSIRDNVILGAPEASEDDVQDALKAANATTFVERMESGSLAVLGEQGVRLSGGERQRIAIARAIVRKPVMLLLDEATSALDATSEKEVQAALDEIMQSRTTLFIAHRLTTAARANRILVVSRGEVVEQGTHAELVQANGAYAGLFRAFSGGILENETL